MSRKVSFVEFIRSLPESERRIVTKDMAARIGRSWKANARPAQWPPDGDWRTWLIMAGRGFGKTRAGAEWVNRIAGREKGLRIALVGATTAEVRKVMIEGESGILATCRNFRPRWEPTRGLLSWPGGSKGFVYSGENPEGLRGPQHHAAWCDEIAKWAYPEGCWDNLQLGLRLGDAQRALVTTTPRPGALLLRLLADPTTVLVGGATQDNKALSPDFIARVVEMYGGTRLGRQELDGELIEDAEGALWPRALIESRRVRACPGFARVVIGVDPPAGAGAGSDACGIVAVGRGLDGLAYVLSDDSVQGLRPEGWARAAARSAERWSADRVVAEANNGGAMVRSVLEAAEARLAVKLVHASRGKTARAEPVAALFEAGRAWFAGAFPDLEDELAGLSAGGDYQGPGRSPDRADAMVWAMSELMLGKERAVPRVRVV